MAKRWFLPMAVACSLLGVHPLAALNFSVATVVPVLSGCLEDECDRVKQDCRDQGLKPKNCKQEQTPVSDKCKCECVAK